MIGAASLFRVKPRIGAAAVVMAWVLLQVAEPVMASGLSVLPGSIRGFVMTTCRENQKVCYSLSSERAEGSTLKRLFVLENVRLTIADQKLGKDRSDGKPRTETWPKGYVDLDMNRLVVWRTEGATRTEKFYDF